jgi:hypothetical protein
MDDAKLVRLQRLLEGTPTTYTEDELDNLLGAAAYREARERLPVAQTYPELALYLQHHLDIAEEYETLVWLIQQDLADTKTREPAAGRPTPTLDLPAPASLPPAIPGLADIRIPPTIVFGATIHRRSTASEAASDAPQFYHEQQRISEQPPIDMELFITMQEDTGSFVLKLTDAAPASDTVVTGSVVRLYDSNIAEDIAVLSEPALLTETIANNGEAVFSLLEPYRTYYLLVDMPAGRQIIIHIPDTVWP